MNIEQDYAAIPARYPELKGQVAIVTGSGRGIGAGIAARLAKEGMTVVISGLEGDQVNAVADALQAQGAATLAVPGNLAETSAIHNLFEQTLATFGTVDLLVNNAADLRRMPYPQVSQELIDYQLLVNVRAPMLCAQQAGEIMRAKGSGSIINVTTPGAVQAHLPGLPYDATKGAMDSFTRAMAIEYMHDGVRVNGLAPGWANTNHRSPDSEQYQAVSARIPAGRPVHVLELAAAVAFLASPDAAYIVGQILYVDGGVTAQMSPLGQPI